MSSLVADHGLSVTVPTIGFGLLWQPVGQVNGFALPKHTQLRVVLWTFSRPLSLAAKR